MRVRPVICKSLMAAALGVLAPVQSRAAGFYLEDQSAQATGRAYSGEAADLGPDSLWWNPASIAGIQHSEIDNTLTGVLSWSKATDQGSTIGRFGEVFPLGGDSRETGVVASGLVPSGAGALRLSDSWAVGVAVTSPFSFITQYPTQSWTRYAALTSRLETIDVQPTLAWRPAPWLGLGAGPNIEHVLTALSSALPNLSPFQPDGIESLHAEGWNLGYNVGLQLHLLDDRLTFGAAYRSRIHHTLSGSLDVAGLTSYLAGQNFSSSAAKANFTTPWTATFGARFALTRQLTLDGQVVRTGWSTFDAVNVTQPVAQSVPEGYHDTTNGAIGIDYKLNPEWLLRAGVQYDPTPTPNGTRDPRVPDADRVLFAVGGTLQVTPAIAVDAGAIYIDVDNAHIDHNASAYTGTPLSTPIQLTGEVQSSAVVLSLGARLKF